jgi:hypothetical protein
MITPVERSAHLPYAFEHAKKPSRSTEIAKSALRISQELSFHHADDHTLFLLKDLQPRIEELRNDQSTSSQSVLRILTSQLESLFSDTLSHYSPEKKQIAAGYEHLLSIVEPEKSVSHLQKLMNFHLQMKEYPAVLSILVTIAPKLEKPLQERISSLQNTQIDSPAKIFQISLLCHRASRISQGLPITPAQEHGLLLLNTALTSESTAALSEKEISDVSELLTEACKNGSLHRALKAKKGRNRAEEFLLRFSHATFNEEQAHSALIKISSILSKPAVQTARKECHDIAQSIFHLKSSLSSFIRTAPQDLDRTVIQKLQEILLLFPEKAVSWSFLETAHETIQSLKAILEQLPEGTVPKETFTALTSLTHRTRHFTTSVLQNLKETIQKTPVHEKLSQSDIRVLAKFSEFEKTFSRLQDITRGSSPSSRFRELLSLVAESAVSITAVNELFQVLPGYKPGDVLIDIEPLQKKPGETVWSKERKEKGIHPTRIFKLVFQWMTKGFASIAPYFTGKATHVSIAHSDNETLKSSEIFHEGYADRPLDFQASMSKVGYRQNLLSQLTPEGKELLSKLTPPLSQETISKLFEEEINTQQESSKNQFDRLYESASKSWVAYARNVEKAAWKQPYGVNIALGSLATAIRIIGTGGIALGRAIRSAFHTLEHLLLKRHSPQKKFPTLSTEFVIQTIEKAQSSVEAKLAGQLHAQGFVQEGQEVHLFHPLVPCVVKTRTLLPKNLKTLLKQAHYLPLDTPLAMQLFLQPGNQSLPPEESFRPYEVSEQERRSAIASFSQHLYTVRRSLEPARTHPSFIPLTPLLSQNQALESLRSSLSSLEPIFAHDTEYAAVLRNAYLLVDAFKTNTELLTNVVFPLIRKTIVDGPSHEGLSAERGSQIAAMLLFLNAEQAFDELSACTQEKNFQLQCSQIEKAAKEHMEKRYNRWKGTSFSVVSRKGAFSSLSLPVFVAQVMMLPTGRINLDIKPLVQKFFATTATLSTSEEEAEVFRVLDELSSNPTLVAKVEAMPTPKNGTVGQRLVNATLSRPFNTLITTIDSKTAVFATLLAQWRQGNIGSCHVTCLLQQVKDASLHWILEDFVELLSHGVITRKISQHEVLFYGLEKMALIRATSPVSLSLFPILAKEAPVQNAMVALGCSEHGLLSAARRVASDGIFTLKEAFEALPLLPTSPRERSEVLERAFFSLEAPEQPPLWRVWENAVASMSFAPTSSFIPTHSEPEQRKECISTLEKFLISIAFSIGLQKLPGKLLRSLMMLKLKKGTLATDPLFESFGKIRFCYTPSQAGRLNYCEWTIAYESEEGLTVARSGEDICLALKAALIETLKKAGMSQKRLEAISPLIGPDTLLPKIRSAFDSSKKEAAFLLGSSHEVALTSLPIAEGYRPSKTLAEKKIYVAGTSGIKNFLEWASEERARTTISPFATVIASSRVTEHVGHAFRLLPNHPTVISCSLEHQAAMATNVCIQPVSVHRHACTEVIAEISTILDKHREKASTIIDTVKQNLVLKYGSGEHRFYGAYLETLIEEVQLVSGITFSREELIRIDMASLKGLLKDSPSYKASLIHFADTNWKGNTPPVDLHFCFYLIPRTKQWVIVAAPDESDTSIRILTYPIRKISIQQQMTDISSAVGEKHAFLLEKKGRESLLEQQEKFTVAWNRFIQKVSVLSDHEKKELMNHYDTLEIGEPLNEAEEALQQCFKAQSEYQRIVGEQFSHLDPHSTQWRVLTFGGQREVLRYCTDPVALKNQVQVFSC